MQNVPCVSLCTGLVSLLFVKYLIVVPFRMREIVNITVCSDRKRSVFDRGMICLSVKLLLIHRNIGYCPNI